MHACRGPPHTTPDWCSATRAAVWAGAGPRRLARPMCKSMMLPRRPGWAKRTVSVGSRPMRWVAGSGTSAGQLCLFAFATLLSSTEEQVLTSNRLTCAGRAAVLHVPRGVAPPPQIHAAHPRGVAGRDPLLCLLRRHLGRPARRLPGGPGGRGAELRGGLRLPAGPAGPRGRPVRVWRPGGSHARGEVCCWWWLCRCGMCQNVPAVQYDLETCPRHL